MIRSMEPPVSVDTDYSIGTVTLPERVNGTNYYFGRFKSNAMRRRGGRHRPVSHQLGRGDELLRVPVHAVLGDVQPGVLFGLGPALQATRPSLTGALKEDGERPRAAAASPVAGLKVSGTLPAGRTYQRT